MSRLHMSLLGTPYILHDGQPVSFSTRKALALLIYLVVEGKQFSREKITTLFWPESDTARGRGSLRLTLTYLREALNEKAVSLSSSQSQHLFIERDTLSFNFTSEYELDLDTIDSAYKHVRFYAGSVELPEDTHKSTLAHLQSAIQLYQGDFLDGFAIEDAPDFDDWIRLQRESWHRRMDAVFDCFSRLQIATGEIAAAIESTTLWMDHDPLNEAIYQRLMQLYMALGERNSALEIYHACQQMLAKEFGTEPTMETERLAERIRTRSQAQTASAPIYHPARSSQSFFAFADSPMVGRAREYNQLIEALQYIQQGHSLVVLLKGEAGIGKTRLANAFIGWAAAQGSDILQGRAFETGSNLPYQSLLEGLRIRLERENAPDDLLSDTWLAELSSILPELRDRYPDLLLPTLSEATAQTRLFEAVVRLGEALAERGPVLFFIDDAQWADAATLDLLHYAGRRWREDNASILLLLSVRTETLLSTLALAKWFSGFERDLQATTIRLGLLTYEDITQLIERLVYVGERSKTAQPYDTVLEEFCKWLLEETRGQPFYIIETLKVLLERGVFISRIQKNGKWAIDFDVAAPDKAKLRSILPHSVREVIRLRLAQLSSSALALLAAFAVLGHNATFEYACQVADLRESDGLNALDELLKSHHLTDEIYDQRERDYRSAKGAINGTLAITYYYTHDKIRDVVYSEAGEARQRLFHRRALDILLAEGDIGNRTYAAELARHASAAGMIEPAFRFSIAAGDEHMHLFAVRDAIAHYERALHILQKNISEITSYKNRDKLATSTSDIEHLYLQLGRAYEIVNEFEKARDLYSRLRLLADELEDKLMKCTAFNRLAMLAILERYDLEQASIFLKEALPLAQEVGDSPLLAETEWNTAQVNFHAWNAGESYTHAKQALELSRKFGLQELNGRSLNVLAYSRLLVGEWHEAERYAEEGRSIYSLLNNRAMEVDCLCQVAFSRIGSGQLQEGISIAQEALRISKSIENTWGQVYSAFHIAMGLLEYGSYSEALIYAQQAVSMARSEKLDVFVCLNLAMEGRIHRAMLNLSAAIVAHKEALELNDTLKAPWTEMIASELCVDYALKDDWDIAYMYARDALNHSHHSPYFYVGHTHWFKIEALVRAGDIEIAAEDTQSFGEQFAHDRRFRIPYLRSLAVLDRDRGELQQAIEHLQEAQIIAHDIALPGELWSIKAVLGELFRAHGHEDLASQEFAQAAVILNELRERLETENQRQMFLESPIVRRIVEASSS